MTQPYVVAGCPVRNRAWIIERHVAAVKEQAPRPTCFYLVNDSDDRTEQFLYECMPGALDDYEVFDTNHQGYTRTGEHRYHDDQHANLASLRNHWIERALELYPQASHLWMVDSDVVPDPDCLEKLLAADKDIVAGVVRNGDGAWNFMTVSELVHGVGDVPTRTRVDEVNLHHETDPFEVSLLGACVLVKREVLERKTQEKAEFFDATIFYQPSVPAVRFWSHPRGEDFTWCSAAKAAGFDLWLQPLARTMHWMSETEALYSLTTSSSPSPAPSSEPPLEPQ